MVPVFFCQVVSVLNGSRIKNKIQILPKFIINNKHLVGLLFFSYCSFCCCCYCLCVSSFSSGIQIKLEQIFPSSQNHSDHSGTQTLIVFNDSNYHFVQAALWATGGFPESLKLPAQAMLDKAPGSANPFLEPNFAFLNSVYRTQLLFPSVPAEMVTKKNEHIL